MILNSIALGLVLGLIPVLNLRHKAVVTVVSVIGLAAYITFDIDGSLWSPLGSFALAVANTAIGIAVGMGVVALVRRITPRSSRSAQRTA